MLVNTVGRRCPFVLNTRLGGIIPVIFMMTALAAAPGFSQLREIRQLTSNNVIALAGGGDTLWAATERGLNCRTPAGPLGGWLGFEANDLPHRFWGLAFGGGGAVAVINRDRENLSDSIGFWHYGHAGGRQQQRFFRFPAGLRDEEGRLPHPVGGAVFSRGSFWTPFGRGGMVRYDPGGNNVYAMRPGDSGETPPQNIGSLNIDGNGKDARTVLSLYAGPAIGSSSGNNPPGSNPSSSNIADNAIMVTTPAVVWAFYPDEKRWDTLYMSPVLSSPGDEFISFGAAFTVSKKNVSTQYSFMTVRRGGEDQSALFVLDINTNRWFRAVDGRARFSLYPAVNGSMYALFDDNRVALYADTGTGAGRENNLSEILSPAAFRSLLAGVGDEPNPNPEVNDLLFIPRSDSSGMLVVAAATGLYVCEYAEPLAGRYEGWSLSRHVRAVGRGEAYALPGVVRGGAEGRYEKCVFVYKLAKDGDVTIRVYDCNMSLVKTVVRGARRGSRAERSTDPARDAWDGTNEAGKRVWPGVYYFKITSSGGERFFGKIILAK